ncbi:MAG: hypothetical protein QNJ14_16235 [Woeseiaceae bacterium]|nr:hypothetical protein [Woeseiaceae bacterium]
MVIAIVVTLNVLALCSLVGVMQAEMLSGAQNYSAETAMHNVYVWGGIATASVVLATVLAVRLYEKGVKD